MKKLFLASMLAGVLALSACGAKATPTPAPVATPTPAPVETPTPEPAATPDAVTSASPTKESSDPAVLLKSLSAEGEWIFSVLSDINVNETINVDGEFHDKNDTTAKLYRKLALYAQDAARNVTAEYTLTAPLMNVNSPAFRIQNGTFKGNIYVTAEGFELAKATVNGDITFATQELMDSAILDTGTVNGTVSVGSAPAAAASGAKIYTGQGTALTLSQKAPVADGKHDNYQVDAIFASLTFEEGGKIIAVTFDNAQVPISYDKDGKMTSPLGEVKTKIDKGDEYGMKRASGIGKEWFEQAAAFQEWMVGKNVEEVLGMKTFKKDDAHTMVPDEADLKTSVTIDAKDYLEAIEKAYHNATASPIAADKVYGGQGHTVKLSEKAIATGFVENNYQVDAIFATLTIDDKDTILGVAFDNAQIAVNYDEKGAMTTPVGAFKSKQEKGDEYGMKRASAIGKEWFEQAAAFQEWMVGKNVQEVLGMKTFKKDDAHPMVPDEADLKTSVSIDASDYLTAIKNAYDAIKK